MYNVEDQSDLLLENLQGDDEGDDDILGEKGDGVAKVKGFILFVPGTKKDQKVRIRVTKVFKKVGFAEVINEIQDNSQEDQQIEDTEDFGEETNGG